jgi:hypothetical protein
MKVALRAGLSIPDVAKAINGIEALVRQQVPAARIVYIEPDVYSSAPATSRDA